MNKCIFQFWEESLNDNSSLSDGCSIHLSEVDHKNFLQDLYSARSKYEIPQHYDKTVGEIIHCFVSDEIYEQLQKSGSIRLAETEKNNLIQLEEIIFKS